MKIRFTEHAVERFVERRLPSASRREALREMIRLAELGTLIKEKTIAGDSQLLAEDTIFVLKHDRRGMMDCTTVLFDLRAADTNALAEEVALFGVAPMEALCAPTQRRRHSRRASRW